VASFRRLPERRKYIHDASVYYIDTLFLYIIIYINLSISKYFSSSVTMRGGEERGKELRKNDDCRCRRTVVKVLLALNEFCDLSHHHTHTQTSIYTHTLHTTYIYIYLIRSHTYIIHTHMLFFAVRFFSLYTR